MKLSQAIKPSSYFKSHAAEVIRELNEQHSTAVPPITNSLTANDKSNSEKLRVQGHTFDKINCSVNCVGPKFSNPQIRIQVSLRHGYQTYQMR